MSERKINLKEIIERHTNVCYDDYNGVIDAMEDFGKQLLKLASENVDNTIEKSEEEIYIGLTQEINNSILDTIKQIEKLKFSN